MTSAHLPVDAAQKVGDENCLTGGVEARRARRTRSPSITRRTSITREEKDAVLFKQIVNGILRGFMVVELLFLLMG
jgi:hypothetical protein